MSRLPGLGAFTVPQRFLLASSFLIPLASFAVLPFMSVLLHQRLGLGLPLVGVVLAVASLIQFAGGIVGAAVAERVGLRRTMLLALVVRTVGFAGFVPGLRWPAVAVVALGLTSCGAALYLPANKAYLIHRADPQRRPMLLAASGSAFNAGIALGPLAAGPFVMTASTTLFALVTGLFVVVAAGHFRLPPEPPGGDAGDVPDGGDAEPADGTTRAGARVERPRRVLDGLPVLPFAITALSLYLFMFFQHFLAVYAVPRTSATWYGVVLMAYSAAVVVLQPALSNWIGRLRYPQAMRVGFATIGTGMAVLAVAHPAALLAGALLICLGEIVLFLKNDLVALEMSDRSPAVVFGQQRLAAGIGALVSGVVGGIGYQYLDRLGNAGWFWLAVAAQCLLLPPLVIVLARWLQGTRPPPGPPARSPGHGAPRATASVGGGPPQSG
ncbi:MFS transporter [Micromonospora inyonensis]|uniref:Major Facilitator Superfamily protein n=1 Tax=Micromonospora inyonensis TaxID=47866 RepID=A0A1C6RES1_9ACTN|nr:MFS transporter [Micromonospora inyonensis]SCL15466.1 Major Facilitator Superfamily protein [Micromonospora inyonensis]